MQCRRLVRDFERLAKSVESFIYVAMTRLLVRRLKPECKPASAPVTVTS